MALIGTLREKMGTWVVVFVFLAISAFVLTDVLSNNSVLFRDDSVGEIAGESISVNEYQRVLDERVASFTMNNRRRPTDADMTNLRREAWELLFVRHAIRAQYEKLGVTVPVAELKDMIHGTNVNPGIRQNPGFQDPTTGEFDRDRVLDYISSLNEPPTDFNMAAAWEQERVQWELFQHQLNESRQRLKYENLILHANYVTKAEAEREYHNATDVAEMKFLYIPYYTVSDTLAEVSEEAVKAYYKKHRNLYRTEPTRDIKYVSFDLVASPEDTAAIVDELEAIARQLKETENDSAYVVSVEGEEALHYFNRGTLPDFVEAEQLKEGNVVGPFLDGNNYVLYSVVSIDEDSVYSLRASHILFSPDDNTEEAKQAARQKALDALREIRNGASFEEKAAETNMDATRNTGGDLGWFPEGAMVQPFNDAVFKANRVGLLNDLVETDFGYHIVKITEPKEKTRYTIAIVERTIAASDETINSANFAAQSFALDLEGEEAFIARAREEGMTVRDAKRISPAAYNVGILRDARPLVQWAFNDAKVGDVSDVFDLRGTYVVAVLTGKNDDEYLPLAEVRDQIVPEVRKESKGKIIIDKLQPLSGTLEEISAAYGDDAAVFSSSDLRRGSNTLPSAGFDPKAVGMAFSLDDGQRSKPFAGESGVLIIEMVHKTTAPSVADYEAYKLQIQQMARNRDGMNIAEAIREDADIVDKRYKFF